MNLACMLHMVGKPVLKRTPTEDGGEGGSAVDAMGTWMMDAFSKWVQKMFIN